MVGLMHALQHLHVAIVSCKMSRRLAVIALHSYVDYLASAHASVTAP